MQRRIITFLSLIVVVIGCLASPSLAAERTAYQPVGATSTPRVDARWNYFRDYDQATELLQQLAAAHPTLCRLESIGTSYGGREMWVLTLTNFEKGEETAKAGFWIDGGIHANELQGTDVALYTAWYLAEMYQHSEFVERLLDHRVFYILPMLSPDSRDAHFYEPNSSSSPRSGQRPVDDDRDGLVDEDGADDLNGDGHISMMRMKDSSGRWKVHPDYPNLMVQCEPDEPGEFTLLWDEGIDNDGDGRINEDGDGYYDPNRDWPWHWQPTYVEGGSHRYPLSIPEDRLAAEFVMEHLNIAGSQSYHNTAGMFLRGPGDPDDYYSYEDIVLYDVIGRHGEEMIPGYKYAVTNEDLYACYGLSADWLYQMQGILSFTNELGTAFNYFRQENTAGWFGSREEQAKFNQLLLFGDGTLTWEEFVHPTYGVIEIGGFKKTWGRQPPSFLLEEECHRNMAFTLYHADQMPQVKVQSIDSEALRPGIWQVTAKVVNNKLLPTHLAVDLNHRITPPDVVALSGSGFTVLTALFAKEPYFEQASEQEHTLTQVELSTIEGMGCVYVRWLIAGELPEAVSVTSIKGGTHRLELAANNP